MALYELLEENGAEFHLTSPVDCNRCDDEGEEHCPYAPHYVNKYGEWNASYKGVEVHCSPKDYLGENFHHVLWFACDEEHANERAISDGSSIYAIQTRGGFSMRIDESEVAKFWEVLNDFAERFSLA